MAGFIFIFVLVLIIFAFAGSYWRGTGSHRERSHLITEDEAANNAKPLSSAIIGKTYSTDANRENP